MFNVDFQKLLTWLLPAWLRKENILLLMLALTWPVRQLYNSFLMFYDAKIYRLTHNSQVCYLQAVLNDHFDVGSRRIYIGDFDGRDRIYFWPQVDRRDVNFGEVQYFWPNDSYKDSRVDFTIHLPADVVTTTPQMAYLKSLTDEYKLAGKKYNIVRI